MKLSLHISANHISSTQHVISNIFFLIFYSFFLDFSLVKNLFYKSCKKRETQFFSPHIYFFLNKGPHKIIHFFLKKFPALLTNFLKKMYPRFRPPFQNGHAPRFSTPIKNNAANQSQLRFRPNFTPIFRPRVTRPQFRHNFHQAVKRIRAESASSDEIQPKKIHRNEKNLVKEAKSIAEFVAKKLESEKSKKEKDGSLSPVTILFGHWNKLILSVAEGTEMKKSGNFEELIMIQFPTDEKLRPINLQPNQFIENILVYLDDYEGLNNCMNPFIDKKEIQYNDTLYSELNLAFKKLSKLVKSLKDYYRPKNQICLVVDGKENCLVEAFLSSFCCYNRYKLYQLSPIGSPNLFDSKSDRKFFIQKIAQRLKLLCNRNKPENRSLKQISSEAIIF